MKRTVRTLALAMLAAGCLMDNASALGDQKPTFLPPPPPTFSGSPLDEYTCYVGTTNPNLPRCDKKALDVKVVPVYAVVPDGSGNPRVRGCVAILPYDRLILKFSTTMSNDQDSITWHLTDASAKWSEEGVSFLSSNNKALNKTFDDDGKANGSDFKIMLRKANVAHPANRVRKQYEHLPTVNYTDPAGNTFDCLGIDPIIINSEG